MSSWNTTSHGCDKVHDNLCDESNPNPTEAACRANVCYIFSDDFVDEDTYSDAYPEHRSCQLGVVIWYIEHGCKVSPKYLLKAISCAEYLLKNENYLANWFNPEKRVESLKKELLLLKKTLKISKNNH